MTDSKKDSLDKVEAAKRQMEAQRRQQAAQQTNEALRRQFAPGASAAAPAAAPAGPKILGKHTIVKGDTYAAIAFKFYGSIKEPFWRYIYEHNKKIIGKHPNDIKLGLEIEIPELTPELKKMLEQ
jgi:nucleoid-associated protein YgaU